MLASVIAFMLAVIAVIINGVPQLLYAQTRGFALKPAGFAYLVGAFGNLLTGSVTPISGQAETITVASVKKNLRNNVSSILLAAVLMTTLGLFGVITKIADFAGAAVVSGMMAGVGLILADVAICMYGQEKRISLISIITAILTLAVATKFKSPNALVWMIFVSVVISTLDFLFIQKRRINIADMLEDGRDSLPMNTEWRFWKKAYWSDFKVVKPTINMTVIFGTLSLMMLNIGANISFGGITAGIAKTTQNYDHLSIINSLADLPSSIFGGPPIEAIISGTAAAPWPVMCGIVFMFVTAILLLTGVVSRLGKYLPAQSIAGFLFIIGLLYTFLPNLRFGVAGADQKNAICGYIALGVTAWSKNPFLGMVAGVLVRYFGMYIGLC